MCDKNSISDFSHVIAVTNRRLVKTDFLSQIEKIAALNVYAVMLREKDLSPDKYYYLAKEVMKICARYHVTCILHKYIDVAKELHCTHIHLPLAELMTLGIRAESGETTQNLLEDFDIIGASVHSIEDVSKAENAGCTYMTAGHVFSTDCKPGLAPKGIGFLKDICSAAKVPVFAIGGINVYNVQKALDAGAYGVCMMSEMMRL